MSAARILVIGLSSVLRILNAPYLILIPRKSMSMPAKYSTTTLTSQVVNLTQ